MDNFNRLSTTYWNNREKMERENQPFKFIDSLHLMAEKCGETIKLGYYTQSGINQNQDNA
jgi:hypothetical protein